MLLYVDDQHLIATTQMGAYRRSTAYLSVVCLQADISIVVILIFFLYILNADVLRNDMRFRIVLSCRAKDIFEIISDLYYNNGSRY